MVRSRENREKGDTKGDGVVSRWIFFLFSFFFFFRYTRGKVGFSIGVVRCGEIYSIGGG